MGKKKQKKIPSRGSSNSKHFNIYQAKVIGKDSISAVSGEAY